MPGVAYVSGTTLTGYRTTASDVACHYACCPLSGEQWNGRSTTASTRQRRSLDSFYGRRDWNRDRCSGQERAFIPRNGTGGVDGTAAHVEDSLADSEKCYYFRCPGVNSEHDSASPTRCQ